MRILMVALILLVQTGCATVMGMRDQQFCLFPRQGVPVENYNDAGQACRVLTSTQKGLEFCMYQKGYITEVCYEGTSDIVPMKSRHVHTASQ